MEPRVAVIFFDAGGVIFNGIPAPMLVKLAERYGDTNTMEEYQVVELRKKIATICSNPAVRQAWNTFKTNPNYTEQMYWENLIQIAGLKETVQECMHLVRESTVVYNDTLQIAQAVNNSVNENGERFTTGIISNHTVEWFSSYLQKCDIQSVFPNPNLIIVSQQVECAKPDIAIFQLAMERICTIRPQTKPEEILFIDDQAQNVDAAKSLGWNAEIFNRVVSPASALVQILSRYGIHL